MYPSQRAAGRSSGLMRDVRPCVAEQGPHYYLVWPTLWFRRRVRMKLSHIESASAPRTPVNGER
jgi:hypothetical protein